MRTETYGDRSVMPTLPTDFGRSAPAQLRRAKSRRDLMGVEGAMIARWERAEIS
jgi:hypothetical protein